MDTTIIITMATISVGSAIAEKILNSLGKQQESQYCSVASSAMLASTALGCVIKAIQELRKL